MNLFRYAATAATAAMVLWTNASAQTTTLTADQIMSKVDDVLYAAKDKQTRMKFVLIDKSGKESVRELVAMEKGSDRRYMKFISPADQKGIGFLSLPNDVMYLYLPSFGKTRRIASHVKNTKFAGTDLSYENLEAKRFSGTWNSKLIGTDDRFYHIELTPKPGQVTEYSRIKVTVRNDIFYPIKVEYFDKAGNPYKVMTRDKLEKIGNYWEARETLMEDLKTQHKTKLIVDDVQFDTGIPDDRFTERYLMQ